MNNIKIENGTDTRLPNLLKGLIFSFLITLISIFLFAIILTYTNISEKTIPIFITVLTFISILIGTIIGSRNIRKNGMLNGAIIGVGIVISDISYKNIINIYDVNGKSLFKTYVATNKVVDISLSKNNQYLAIAEIDMSGVMIQSSIRVISIEKARTDPKNSIIGTHYSEIGKLLLNIEYQNKDRIICAYSDEIIMIENNNQKILKKIDKPKITYSSVELKNNIMFVEESETEKYNSVSKINIANISNDKIKKYETEEIAKSVDTYENVIALNFGTELHIINTNGWLMKKYISKQEINKIVMSNKVVGIIYRDKIEIIEL